MSQMGSIISINPIVWNNQINWSVMYTYQLDAGGTGQAQVFVGPVQPPATVYFGSAPYASVAPWTSPNGTIAVPTNPPGTSNPVVLPCPPLAQAAIFNLPLK